MVWGRCGANAYRGAEGSPSFGSIQDFHDSFALFLFSHDLFMSFPKSWDH